MRVVIGDLVHRAITLSIDSFPYAAGLLAAYARKYAEFPISVEVHRFYEPFMASVLQDKPAIVGLTNYSWNCNLSLRAAEKIRQIYPDCVLILGGPNMPSDTRSQIEFFRSMHPFDIAVLGEGESAFLEILRQFEQVGRQRESLLALDLPSTLIRRPDRTIEGSKTGKAERIKDLDLIPSPYLEGLMDPFFSQGLYPILQTNRGCPFTCTFCLEGTDYYSKVNKFSLERVKEELTYISKRVKPSDVLFIADSNFGMYRRDKDIAEFLAGLQKELQWPKFINCTTGKNSPGTVIQAVDLLNGALEISSSVQSLNPTTLELVRRENIHLSAYEKIQTAIRSRGLRSMADMILCLPGETIESHMEGVKSLLNSGIQRILPYQLMLLNGTQLNTPESREKYKFMTRFRIVARNFGKYDDVPVYEWEEIVVATSTMSFEDYLQCRFLHWILEVYLKQEPFRELFLLMEQNGVSRSDLIFGIYKRHELMPPALANLGRQFLDATQGELFESVEALQNLLQDGYDKLAQEHIGANLLQKYSVSAWFSCLPEVIKHLILVAKELLQEKLGNQLKVGLIAEQLEQIGKYLEISYVNILQEEELESVKTVALSYDVAGWVADGCQSGLDEYQLTVSDAHGGVSPCTRDFVFRLAPKKQEQLGQKLKTFGRTKSGLGKMLTRLYLNDIRREPVV
ncbi:MAG: radical SAM protein [Candidatus Cloacimonetes bacterium]|nr:radical SAM protein [Candidatus Cloacimonadota bacterium]